MHEPCTWTVWRFGGGHKLVLGFDGDSALGRESGQDVAPGEEVAGVCDSPLVRLRCVRVRVWTL